MLTSMNLPKSWPPVARDILVEAARRYNREINEPWAVPDVAMRQVIDEAKEEMGRRQDEIYEEASTRWINRWEHDQLDAEMMRAIVETSRRMSSAERVIRPRTGVRKSRRQLDAEIASVLSEKRR